jgi:hypothetical protein
MALDKPTIERSIYPLLSFLSIPLLILYAAYHLYGKYKKESETEKQAKHERKSSKGTKKKR